MNETVNVQEIKNKYIPHKETKLEALKALDKKANRPANVFAYLFGSVSAVIMGAGMSLVMTGIGSVVGIREPLIPGILIGVTGMVMTIVNYPIYKRIRASRRKKYAPRILALTNDLTTP